MSEYKNSFENMEVALTSGFIPEHVTSEEIFSGERIFTQEEVALLREFRVLFENELEDINLIIEDAVDVSEDFSNMLGFITGVYYEQLEGLSDEEHEEGVQAFFEKFEGKLVSVSKKDSNE
jgi:hypothetical protein